jgi:hypothetical protein
MNRRDLVELAAPIQRLHPDWQQAGILSQLQTLADTWTDTDAAFYAHVMAIAADPKAQTPGAFNATPPTPTPTLSSSPRPWGEPICYTCGRRRNSCVARKAWEIQHNLPDPHDFETLEEAERRAKEPIQFG